MKFMIHSCNQRQWYVDEFLVPSLIKQGIPKEDIYVYEDVNGDGNLKSYIKSSHLAYDMWGSGVNVWHFQDDVVLCHDFKERIDELEKRDLKLICGFVTRYDDGRNPGEAKALNHMWYSFPCMMIRTDISKDFANWCDIYLWRDNQFGFWHRHKKGDDYIFRIYIENYYADEPVLNVAPTLVDHIDYMIGGTLVNQGRESKGTNVRSIYWTDEDEKVVKELEEAILRRNRK